MINIILPIVERIEDYKTMFEYLSKKKDVKVYLGVDERFKIEDNYSNFDIKYFKAKSAKEEIINSLHTIPKERGGIMVIRRPLLESEFLDMLRKEEDIVILNKSRNNFSQMWKNFWKNAIRRLLAFYYFEDISAVFFKENMFELISALTNLSYISRINRFVGLSLGEVETSCKPAKKEYERLPAAVNFLSFFLFLVICVMCSVLLCTALGNTVLTVLLAFTMTLIGFVFFMIAILNLARTVSVGKLRYGRAEEII